MITFKILNSEDGQFYVTVTGGNNKTILTSETYKSKQGALKGIDAIKKGFKLGIVQVIDATV